MNTRKAAGLPLKTIREYGEIATCPICGWTRRLESRVVGLQRGTLAPIRQIIDNGCPKCKKFS